MDVTQVYENAAAEAARIESERKAKLNELVQRIDIQEKQLAEQVTQIFAHFDKLRERLYSSYEAHLDSNTEIRAELVLLRGGSAQVLRLESGKKKQPDVVPPKDAA